MEEIFVIVDTETGNFYQGGTEYTPWIINAFTNRLSFALKYESKDKAYEDLKWFEETKTEFDGNTPLKKGRLAVMQITLKPVK